jgi:hypothetical protein
MGKKPKEIELSNRTLTFSVAELDDTLLTLFVAFGAFLRVLVGDEAISDTRMSEAMKPCIRQLSRGGNGGRGGMAPRKSNFSDKKAHRLAKMCVRYP